MSKLSSALQWVARGFRVFPLKPNAKEPAVSDFGNCASSDPDDVNAWWKDPVTGVERDYNIGVLTNDIIVCDVDVKNGKPGLDTYYSLGGHFETLVVQTPSGGYHCYFHGHDSANTYPGPGLDIRSHNGYVIAPGSEIDGKTYTLLADVDMAWVPLAIEGTLRPPGRRLDRDDIGVEVDSPGAIVHAIAWLADAPVAIEGQGGDNVTYQVAAKMVRDFALSEEVAFEALRRYWNDKCFPPWDAEELWAKVQNAFAYGTAEVGQALPEASFSGNVTVIDPETLCLPSVITFGNASNAVAIPKRPWLVERMLMRRAVTMLIAQGSAGKTTLALTIAAHGAVAKDLGAYKFNAPFKTIIYSAEEDRDELSRRLLALCEEYRLDFEAVKPMIMLIGSDDFDVCIASTQGRQPITNTLHVDWLISVASDPDVGMLVLDPLVEIHLCDEQDNAQMKFVMSLLRRISREANVAMLVPHHTPKGSKEAGNADTSRGAGAIVNSSRVAFTLFPASEQDMQTYGIKEEDKHRFVRLDDAKMNLALASSNSLWFRKNSVKLYNGDSVGVLKTYDMLLDEGRQREEIAYTLADALESGNAGALSMADAVMRLKARGGLYEKFSSTALRQRIERVLLGGVATSSGTLYVSREQSGVSERIWIKLEK